MRTVHLLREITVALHRTGGGFAERHGLHPTDLRALISLLDSARAGTPTTPGRLGAQLGLNSAGTTALVDRLERLGHVRRTRDGKDRRRVLIEVTDSAVTLGEAFFGPLIENVLGVAEEFDTHEVATIDRFLHGVAEAVAPPEIRG
ncbi:MarR family winged helix-turn-helix transcriptional regulator [Streptomyces sp. H39-S7]|uniref:MarR family winged helix-turn-helix transcriptional regulator n=1 Tax=Streptomyces sp. H39-S7 TaxID=3004357 RepID=UPI0022AF8F3D|nr:MarR family transcriptional regulator [Streptomyces sp. H39-S7]MCZ4120965.1 MarR family transcriptional regulator [Streptomyces sp. H39-S7]